MAWLLDASLVLTKPWVQRLLLGITTLLVGIWIADLLAQVDLHSHRVQLRWIAVALILNAVYLVGYAACWHTLTQLTGAGLPFRRSVPIWLFSILGKYVPGRVLGIATRVSLIERRRPGTSVIVAATCVVESMASTAAGLIVCTLVCGLAAAALRDSIGLSREVPLIAGITAVLATPILYRMVRWALRKRLTDPSLTHAISSVRWALIMLAYAGLWMLWGTILVAVVAAVDASVALDSAWSIAWIYQLAGITGILMLFTPSGLGAREAVMLAGLLLIVPGPVAALITVCARLVNIIVEGCAVAVGYTLLGSVEERRGRD